MNWTVVAKPASTSQPGKRYTVRRSDGGTLWCDCPAFTFADAMHKRCSHTDEQVAIEERQAIESEAR